LKDVKTVENKAGLQAVIDVADGTYQYSQGESNVFIEEFVSGQLESFMERNEEQYPEANEKANKKAKKILLRAIKGLDKFLIGKRAVKYRKYKRQRAAARYRLAHLYILTGSRKSTYDILEQNQRESDLKNIDKMRYYATILSLINADYFFRDFDKLSSIEELNLENNYYIKEINECLIKENTIEFPAFLSRLRITQADNIFSFYFKYNSAEDSSEKFKIRENRNMELCKPDIRKMLKYYIEACNYMILYNESTFQIIVHTIVERLEYIPRDAIDAIDTIIQGFRSIWNFQENLKNKNNEIESLVRFAEFKSLSVIIGKY
jgi:hypothetical protein